MSGRPWTGDEDNRFRKNQNLPAAKRGRMMGRRSHEVF